MVDLNKEEHVYLMTIRIQNKVGHPLDYNVIPFKSKKDVNHAMINVIANNIKNNRDNISHISYEGEDYCNGNPFACARVEFKSGIAKTYEGIRRKIQEVK